MYKQIDVNPSINIEQMRI